MRRQLPASLCLLLCSITGGAASSLATFADPNCKTSLDTITGEDGYPDGVCTNIRQVSEGLYEGFMFINLDDGCIPTIYQNDTDSDTCSGADYVAYISDCYNTSWAYYSIDECTPLASGSASSSSSSSTAPDTSSTDNGISGGAIAGAVVGSACILGVIAAVCVYLFWFRPKQKREKKEDAEKAAANEALLREEALRAALSKPHELQQQPHELQSPVGTGELSTEGIAEAPGDKGGVEVDNDAQLPAELPGDHEHRGSDSSGISHDHE